MAKKISELLLFKLFFSKKIIGFLLTLKILEVNNCILVAGKSRDN